MILYAIIILLLILFLVLFLTGLIHFNEYDELNSKLKTNYKYGLIIFISLLVLTFIFLMLGEAFGDILKIIGIVFMALSLLFGILYGYFFKKKRDSYFNSMKLEEKHDNN